MIIFHNFAKIANFAILYMRLGRRSSAQAFLEISCPLPLAIPMMFTVSWAACAIMSCFINLDGRVILSRRLSRMTLMRESLQVVYVVVQVVAVLMIHISGWLAASTCTQWLLGKDVVAQSQP
jgi:hypothetical protein